MDRQKEELPKYFQEALGDFVHDAASGGAIRHLLDLGYTTDAIMQKLEFPTPRARVEKTVYRYLTERGILMEELPVSGTDMRSVSVDMRSEAELCALLRQYIEKNGEENSYVSCPFGTIRRDRERRLQKMLSCLTAREREYITGIPWKPQVMYHRLNSRMLEIAVYLTTHSNVEMKFYFFKSKETVVLNGSVY
ncbi:MAG: hypothetical protein Q4F83_02145 [Eubacteriales bacterium]|nr:hypothetical protein [Eubacteriales bacterium]